MTVHNYDTQNPTQLYICRHNCTNSKEMMGKYYISDFAVISECMFVRPKFRPRSVRLILI